MYFEQHNKLTTLKAMECELGFTQQYKLLDQGCHSKTEISQQLFNDVKFAYFTPYLLRNALIFIDTH